ncbi:MAG: DUF3368 domain-containing protein [Bacteroidota bacterium]
MPEPVIVSDASVLIGLEQIGSLSLLKELYGRIDITSIVQQEVGSPLPDWVHLNDAYQEAVFRLLCPSLDEGEASAIALALAHPGALLIIDERKGRKQAKSMGIRITGLVGIIIRAKQKGLIHNGKEKLDQLMEKGFRLSDGVYALALEQMGESIHP